MADTSIEWTERTWNPIVGCSLVSPGCTNCYAMKMARRLELMGTVAHYTGLTQQTKAGPVWSGKLALAPDHVLLEPLRRRKPTTYFVNSMGDLFHESVPDEWIDRVFAVMALAPQHTFQILTKRAERMRDYLGEARAPWGDGFPRNDAQFRVWICMPKLDREATGRPPPAWPLPNVWLGVSAEDQKRAEERVPDLLATPAAVRFVSAEPLLGPIDFAALDINGDGEMDALNARAWLDEIEQWRGTSETWEAELLDWFSLSALPTGGNMHPVLDWIIVGGESGPGARPMHPDWPRQIRDACAAAGTAFFFKQWGEHEADQIGPEDPRSLSHPPGHVIYRRVGKNVAGRKLEGVEHNAMPEVTR